MGFVIGCNTSLSNLDSPCLTAVSAADSASAIGSRISESPKLIEGRLIEGKSIEPSVPPSPIYLPTPKARASSNSSPSANFCTVLLTPASKSSY